MMKINPLKIALLAAVILIILQLKNTVPKRSGGMTKSQLIDAIASGSKLTKADAGVNL